MKPPTTATDLLLPALIAAIGFVFKSLYDLFVERQRRQMQNIEDKLKHFYWPILIRLEKDNAIWKLSLAKGQDSATTPYKMASTVERAIILKNHEEILDIIDNYVHLAEPDDSLIEEIKKYINNVTIYKALRESGDEKTFPEAYGAIWPREFFNLIKAKTHHFQTRLNSSRIV